MLEAEIVNDRPNPIWQQSPTVANHNIPTYDVEAEDINSGSLVSKTDEAKVTHEVKAETVIVRSDVVNKAQNSTTNGVVTTSNSKTTTRLNNLTKRSATK